jgi:hypothetical protein
MAIGDGSAATGNIPVADVRIVHPTLRDLGPASLEPMVSCQKSGPQAVPSCCLILHSRRLTGALSVARCDTTGLEPHRVAMMFECCPANGGVRWNRAAPVSNCLAGKVNFGRYQLVWRRRTGWRQLAIVRCRFRKKAGLPCPRDRSAEIRAEYTTRQPLHLHGCHAVFRWCRPTFRLPWPNV